jgi:hypothetical protein
MGVDATALARCDNINPLSGDIEGGHRQDKAKSGERTDRANLGLLQVPAT